MKTVISCGPSSLHPMVSPIYWRSGRESIKSSTPFAAAAAFVVVSGGCKIFKMMRQTTDHIHYGGWCSGKGGGGEEGRGGDHLEVRS